MSKPIDKGEIIIYQPEDKSTHLEVRIEEETVWLSQAQMLELFNSTKQNISLHINNIFKEGELNKNSAVKYSLTTASDTVSHLGKSGIDASLKDLGKKWFAFSKIKLDAKEIITKLN